MEINAKLLNCKKNLNFIIIQRVYYKYRAQ